MQIKHIWVMISNHHQWSYPWGALSSFINLMVVFEQHVKYLILNSDLRCMRLAWRRLFVLLLHPIWTTVIPSPVVLAEHNWLVNGAALQQVLKESSCNSSPDLFIQTPHICHSCHTHSGHIILRSHKGFIDTLHCSTNLEASVSSWCWPKQGSTLR